MDSLNVYVVFDDVARQIVVVSQAPNDGTFIRQNARMLKSFNSNFINDFSVWRVGAAYVTDESCDWRVEIDKEQPVAVSWDAYKFPESPVTKENNKE